MITWPDFTFPPINLYTIGVAWHEDSRINSNLSARNTPFDTYGQHISDTRTLLTRLCDSRQHN